MKNSKTLSLIYTAPVLDKDGASYLINVTYKLYWNKKVEVIGIGFKPELLTLITNPTQLVEDIQTAAEADSKRYAIPGLERAGRIDQDPREVMERENQQVYK